MDEREGLFAAAAQGFLAGFVVIRAAENHFRAMTARRGNFYQRSGERHDDLRSDAAFGGVIGDGLCVIAGRRRGDAAAAVVGGVRAGRFVCWVLEFILLSPKKRKGRCPLWVTACGAETGSCAPAVIRS